MTEQEQSEAEQTPTRKLPTYGVIRRGKKKVQGRVTQYHGRGYFSLLLPGDIHVYKHRDAIEFTNNTPFQRDNPKKSA